MAFYPKSSHKFSSFITKTQVIQTNADVAKQTFFPLKIEFHNPRNTVAVELFFRGEKMAKVVGALAMEKPEEGHKVSGILVKRNFNYHILAGKC